MLYAICIEMVWFYAYGAFKPTPELGDLRVENAEKIETWCRMALSITATYAEPYFILGDVYLSRDLTDNASRMYMKAQSLKMDGGKFQNPAYYQDLPANRISIIFERKGMFEMSMHFAKLAQARRPAVEYVARIKGLAAVLLKEYSEYERTN